MEQLKPSTFAVPAEEVAHALPWPWLTRAACLPGRALHAALYLLHRSLESGKQSFWLRIEDVGQLGLDRSAVYRSLNALEGGGLIKVRRRSGTRPFVTMLDCDPVDEGAGP